MNNPLDRATPLNDRSQSSDRFDGVLMKQQSQAVSFV